MEQPLTIKYCLYSIKWNSHRLLNNTCTLFKWNSYLLLNNAQLIINTTVVELHAHQWSQSHVIVSVWLYLLQKVVTCSLVPRPVTFSVARRNIFRVTENGAGLGTRLSHRRQSHAPLTRPRKQPPRMCWWVQELHSHNS